MGKFDLNNAADFARATNSFGSSILSLFTGRGESAWSIEEGAYRSGTDPSRSVIFHVFRSQLPYSGAMNSISDNGGRRKANFEFPYLDAMLSEDMGRKPDTFNLSIVLHGNNYLNAMNELLIVLNEPTPGTLIHPVRGEIVCVMDSYQLLHQDSMRKAVAITLNLSEASIQSLRLRKGKDASAPSKLSKLTAAFVKIENAINAVQGAGFLVQTVKNTITQNLQAYQAAFAKVSGNMNATFNPGGSIPGLLPVQNGGVQNEEGEITTNAASIVASPNDALRNTPLELIDTGLQTALAVEQLNKDIIAVRIQLLTSINDLTNADDGQGALEFYDNIIDLRETANDMQDAYEAGKQSSQFKLINYRVPRVMSVREVAFANGISPDDSVQVAQLNPELESLNFIEKGTVLKVAVST